jgi:hypothetical protein
MPKEDKPWESEPPLSRMKKRMRIMNRIGAVVDFVEDSPIYLFIVFVVLATIASAVAWILGS